MITISLFIFPSYKYFIHVLRSISFSIAIRMLLENQQNKDNISGKEDGINFHVHQWIGN